MYTVRNDFHAIHHSGVRRLSAIELFVLHDMEDVHYLTAAENTGRWFERMASGGSTHYGIDNNSIQRYLALNVICWGAPNANTNGVHFEQMGKASWVRETWMQQAKPTLDRTAWLLARVHKYLEARGVIIPLRKLGDDELRAHKHGIVTHRQVTRVLGGGSHTDPGSGYPMAWVVDRARHYNVS